MVKCWIALLLLPAAQAVMAGEGAAAAYPERAPVQRYLESSSAQEIALARSAAPPAISQDAQILTLGPKGYEIAVTGKNHFVCLVERSWAMNFDAAEFWNPRMRAPHCLNGAAARSVLPTYLKRTEWVLSGLSKAQMLERTRAALARHEVPVPESGAMAYMMSRDGYLGDDAGGPWHPHLMFYLPRMAPADWGAGLEGAPVMGDSSALEPVTVFFVPLGRWSDGTPAAMGE